MYVRMYVTHFSMYIFHAIVFFSFFPLKAATLNPGGIRSHDS
jgi:hypothetical protein